MSEPKKGRNRPDPLDDSPNGNTEENDRPNIRSLFTAWVLFKTDTPNTESVKKQLRRYDLHVVDADDGELLIPVEGCDAAYLRPEPRLSQDMLDVFFAASVFCKDVDYLCKQHRSVVKIAFDIGEKPALDYCRTFLRIVTAALESQGTMGLCLNGILRDKAQFLQLSRQSFNKDAFDASLFISTSVYYEDKTHSLFTVYSLGCEIFGLPELEIRHVPLMQIDRCAHHIFHLATNYLWNGVKLHTGDVLSSPNDKNMPLFRVTEEGSYADPTTPVLTLTPLTKEEEAAVPLARRPYDRETLFNELLKAPTQERQAILQSLGLPPTDQKEMLQLLAIYDGLNSEDDEDDPEATLGRFQITVLFSSKRPNLTAMKARLHDLGLSTVSVRALNYTDEDGRELIPSEVTDLNAIGLRRDDGACQGVVAASERLSKDMRDVIALKSPLCQNAKALLKKQRSTMELLLTVRKDKSPLDYLRLLALMLRAALADNEAIAICQRGVLIDKAQAQQIVEACSGKQFFSALVVAMNVFIHEDDEEDPATITLYTEGCDAFGLPELEMHHIAFDEADTQMRHLLNIASFCLLKGKRLQDGEVFEMPNMPPVQAHEVTSFIFENTTAIELTPFVSAGEAAHA